ncbi:ankyrin repeat-containing domain protein [Tuber brumale]|nr:ankyrin repeat-containing domain protein [Tuber brumale]
MTLLSLPNELLLQISTEQSLPEINALLRTNQRLATLLRPALLRRLVRVGSSEYAERALHHFGERGDTRTAAWLLDHRILELTRADVLNDILSMQGEAIMLTLLDAGLDPDIRCLSDRTLLMIAGQHGCARVVERLLACGKGVNVNALDSYNKTALQYTIQGHQGEMAMMLLADPRVDVNWPDRNMGLPPLDLAMSLRMVDVVAAITRDPRVEIPPPDGEDTWLHHAVPYGDTATISLLLADQRINVNARNQAGMTAYMTAIAHQQRWSIYLLLKDERVDRSLGPGLAQMPIHLAARHGWPEVLQILLADRTVDVNSEHHNETPLFAAICFRRSDIVRMLVDDPRVDVNLSCVDELPLILAARDVPACREIVLLLLSRDDVDLSILNQGAPESWDPSLHKMILRGVVGHAPSKTRRPGSDSRDGAVAPRTLPTSVMEQIRARGRHCHEEAGDDW